MNSILIYVPTITPRTEYIFSVFLKSLLGLNFELTNDKVFFEKYNEPKFSYAEKALSNELFFEAKKMLFEKNINNNNFLKSTIDESFSILNSQLTIDIFAASFYLLTRYEEYEVENFTAEQSILFKDFLQKPLINIWANQLKEILQQHFPALKFKEQIYQFIPTIDVDRAFAFKSRSSFRSVGGFMKDFLKGNFAEVKKRFAVLFQNANDPFDVFDDLEKIHREQHLKAIYFFHCGNYDGVDKNIDLQNEDFKKILKILKSSSTVLLHPSVKSNSITELLTTEKQTLENLIDENVNGSRQHYIKLHFPQTYHQLLKAGIKNDYTMGYDAAIGFRAGICNSFNWYDLQNEQATDLIIHPFCWMEANYQYFHKVGEERLWTEIKQLIDEVKKVNGTFISVWHNHSFSEMYEFKGWKNKYEQFVNLAK